MIVSPPWPKRVGLFEETSFLLRNLSTFGRLLRSLENCESGCIDPLIVINGALWL
jgi:hypothetical protein